MTNTDIPNQREIAPILFDEEKCKTWLVENGIIWKTRTCATCGKMMLLQVEQEVYRHYCIEGRKKMSMWKNTFFSRSKVKPNDAMNMIYLWICGGNHSLLTAVGGHSTNYITNLLKDLNQLLAENLDIDRMKIGGPGVIVEIDESKLSKRKYNRGHRVEGVWIVGGVDRTQARNMFAIEVENRNSETLQAIIEEYVHEGSIILTDCWRGYGFLENHESYEHQTVNHSQNFKDPVTGVHTNSIEGTWAALKSKISKRYRCKNGLTDHLFAFIWRRQNEGSLWNGLIKALSDYEFIE